MRVKTALVLLFALIVLSHQSAVASAYDEGIKLYGQGNYKAAALKFEQAVKANPNDSNSYYYRALSYQGAGDIAKAKAAYQQVISRFPGSQAAQYATQAMTPKSARPVSRSRYSSGKGGGGGESSGPAMQSRVYFTRQGKALIVRGDINNRSIDLIFDTGAEMTTVGKNHLQALGINPPTGEATGMSSGVGSAEGVKTWRMPAKVKVGDIVRDNFSIDVQENLPGQPLLGQDFFKEFEYTIDYGANAITFSKGGMKAASGGSDAGAVAFTKEGNELIVNAEVDGKRCPMIFDTGADGITFTREQAKGLGLSIPEDAEEEIHTGIAGSTKGFGFNVRRIKLGPIDKSDIQVSVIEGARMTKPLLGQRFYEGWQYTIDNQKNVIRFVRR